MSHFTVLVIGDNPEKMLEPYSEELEAPKYKVYLTQEELKRMAKHYEIPVTETKKLMAKMIGWNNHKAFKDKGGIYYLSTYNKNSK